MALGVISGVHDKLMAYSGYSTSNYITWPFSAAGTDQISLAIRVNPTSFSSGDSWFGYGDKDVANKQHRVNNVTATSIGASTFDGTVSSSSGIASPATGSWVTVIGRFSNAYRQLVYDGTADTANTIARTITGIDCIRVGTTPDSTPFGALVGAVAWVAAWNHGSGGAYITGDEITALDYVSPLLVRPSELAFYSPYMGADMIGGGAATITGSLTTVAGTPAAISNVIHVNFTPAAAGGTILPQMMQHMH